MKKIILLKFYVAAALVLSTLGTAIAANLSVFPLRGEMSAAKTSEVFTIRNQGHEPVVVQANVFKWSQKDGQDVLDPTREVLVAPALIEIPPNESQIVRIAVRRPPDANKEDTFRLLIQEIPKSRESKDSKIIIALNISLPIFIAPTSSAAQASLEAKQVKMKKDGSKQHLMVDLNNPGTGNMQITSVQASDGSGAFAKINTLIYVLPGSSRAVVLSADRLPEMGKTIKLEFQTAKGLLVRELVLN